MILGKQIRITFVHKKEVTLMLAEIKPRHESQKTYINLYRLIYDSWKWEFIYQYSIDVKDEAGEPKVINILGWGIFNDIVNGQEISQNQYIKLKRNFTKQIDDGIIEDSSWHKKQWNPPEKVLKRWKKAEYKT